MFVYTRYAGTIYFFFIPPLAYFISSILFNGGSLSSWEIPCTRITVSSIYTFTLESDM